MSHPLSTPSKFRTEICGHCGRSGPIINGAWLRHRRISARIGVNKFAGQAGVTGAMVSYVERNLRGCTPELLKAYQRLKVVR